MEKPIIIEISIPSYRKEKSKVEYQINVISNYYGDEKFFMQVYRRYSGFLDLHNKIKKQIPGLPSFPKKSWFSGSKPSIIEQRRLAFEFYVRYAVNFVIKNKLEHLELGKNILGFIKENNVSK